MSTHRTRQTLAWLVRGTGPAPGPDGELDADRLRTVLERHRLAGAAAVQVEATRARAGVPVLPPHLLRSLEGARVATAVHTTILLETRDRCRALLAGAGIPSLAFKGAALLSAGVYGEPGARAMEDVDVLVAPADAARAVAVLREEGFRPWVPWDPGRLEWLPAFTLDDTRAPPGVRSPVDLHWSSRYTELRTRRRAGPDPLWEGADLEAGLPGPEAHFVLLADHLLKHLRVVRHVRGLVDLARLAPRLRDPERLARAAEARGGVHRAALVLACLVHDYGVGVDPGVLERLRVPAAPPRPLRRYLAPAALLAPGEPSPGRLAGLRLRWAVREEGALRDLLQVLFPPARWLEARYPGAWGGSAGRRLRYLTAMAFWLLAGGPSPLSPNQDVGAGTGA